MFFIIGSEGFLGKKICSLLPKNKTIKISSKKVKNCIHTKIFKDIKKKSEKWIKKIKQQDTIVLLSNPGSINFHENNPKKVLNFEKFLERNFFLKVN